MHSGDPDPDFLDEDRPASNRIDSVSPVLLPIPAGILESPSHYLTPTVPDELSAVSSTPLSPNRVRKDCSSGSLDTDRVFEVSPDSVGLVQSTAPEAPVPFDVSLLPVEAESCLPLMLDGTLAYNLSLVDPGSDLSLVTIPIYPLPAWMALKPSPSLIRQSLKPSPSPIRQSRREHRSPAASSSRDRSREGPFDAYCVPLDTGDHLLVSSGLPGCPYRMTSYAGTNVAEVNTAYGIQVHHPRFLEFIGAPESARLLNRSPAFWIQHMDR